MFQEVYREIITLTIRYGLHANCKDSSEVIPVTRNFNLVTDIQNLLNKISNFQRKFSNLKYIQRNRN